MTAVFSDIIADPTANTTLGVGYRAPVGISHARLRTKIARVTYLALTTDVLRMITLKSSDRLISLELATDGACAAGAVDVGLYLSGKNHTGAVADADMFSTALVVSTETDYVDAWLDSTLLDGVDRGRTMWALATLGAGTNYTVDPIIEFDIVLIASTNCTTTAQELTKKADYTAGD